MVQYSSMHEELQSDAGRYIQVPSGVSSKPEKEGGILQPVRLVNLRIAYQFVYLHLHYYTAEVNNVIQYVFLESGFASSSVNLPTATALASSPEIVNLPLLNFRDLRCHSRISPSVTSIGNFSVVFLPLSMAILRLQFHEI